MHKEFKVHMLNDTGKQKATALAESFDILLTDIEGICAVNTREFSLCKTKLEEACFFAKKSIAEQPENCQ